MKLSMITLSIMNLSIMTLSITIKKLTLGITASSIIDIQFLYQVSTCSASLVRSARINSVILNVVMLNFAAPLAILT